MVIDELREDAWLDLEHEANMGPAELISGMVYDDLVTLPMVAAAARALELSLEECLTRYGRYWVGFAKQGPYGATMDSAGRDIASFIANLDRIHQNVTAIMPDAVVPSFAVTDRDKAWLKVTYSSSRAGLEPFVVGLLEGIIDMFSATGEVRQTPGANNTREFLVTYQEG